MVCVLGGLMAADVFRQLGRGLGVRGDRNERLALGFEKGKKKFHDV
jgi:hypothetical protein